ncbi:MAG: endonuclease domain-containing protein [Chitinophagales bacterium]|nr:endonuclease domain-containing protein [Chitinophagales bacterium]
MEDDDKDLDRMDMFFGAEFYGFRNAFLNRQNMTPAEKIFWEAVKNNQLGFKIRRQHPIGNYIVDFYGHKHKLVIELDGAYHKLKNQKKYDEVRDQEMEKFGLKIFRVSNDRVLHHLEEVIQEILEFVGEA